MAGRLERLFDRAADAALAELDPKSIADQVRKYLADAHAIEEQAIELLKRAPKISQDDGLASLYDEHLDETREHERRLSDRLAAVGGSSSTLKDAGLRLGALSWGAFFAAQPDTPAKLAGFAFAFEHLEVAAYTLLQRVASRAGDEETVRMAATILVEERAAAGKLAGRWDAAIEASLSQVVTA